MIPVQGYAGQTVAVLGLGRTGRAAAVALEAGGANPVVWDDSAVARQAAEDDGLELRDLTKTGAFEDVAALIVSPGIPHLYPKPNTHVAAAATESRRRGRHPLRDRLPRNYRSPRTHRRLRPNALRRHL